MGEFSLEDQVDPLDRLGDAVADDSGQANAAATSRATSEMVDPLAEEEPEVAAAGWNDADWSDDDWDDDDDWGNEDLDEDDPARELRASQDKAHLVSEIRDAVVSVSHVKPEADQDLSATSNESSLDLQDDQEFGRRAIARSQLTSTDAEDRILEETETQMTDRETSRRRSAMAHLKAAAAATKADRVLKHVVSRDPTADPEEQSPYRDDLAKVVRPHRPNSRPISRVVSQTSPQEAVWDQGEGDEDAALYAASTDARPTSRPIEEELAAAEAERLARAPAELSADDFADEEDNFFADAPAKDPADIVASEFPNSQFAAESTSPFDDHDGFNMGQDDFDEEEDDFAPRPSTAVAEAIAFANAPDDEDDITPDEGEVRKKIWEMADEVASEVEAARHAEPEDDPEPFVNVAPVVAGRAGRSAGRVKTRMLGFQPDVGQAKDPFEESAQKASVSTVKFPAGWIVVIQGPGRGASFTLENGVSQIGRGEEQTVRLDFGDTAVSRNNHAAIAYDDEQGKFYLGHGGKSNLVRLNGVPVLSTEEMTNGDQIRIGETTLKFVALCGEEFTWKSTEEADPSS